MPLNGEISLVFPVQIECEASLLLPYYACISMCNASTSKVLQHTVDRGPNLESHTAHTHTHTHKRVHVRTKAKSKKQKAERRSKIQVNFFTRFLFLSFILYVGKICFSFSFLRMKISSSLVISVLSDAIQQLSPLISFCHVK